MSTQAGPNLVSNASNITNRDIGSPDNVPWGSTNAAATDDGAYAAVQYISPQGGMSDLLHAVGFFSVSDFAADVSIVGIQARWERKHLAGSGLADGQCYLTIGGTVQTGTNRSPGGTWTASDAFTTAGGSTDLWGQSSLTGADLHGTGFGVGLAVNKANPLGTVVGGVDFVEMTAWWEAAGGVLHLTRGGLVNNGLVNGGLVA